MKKKFFSLFLAVSVLISVVPIAGGGSIAHAEEAAADVWVENPLKTVFRSSTIPALPDKSISLVSAKNEYESAQIAIRSDAGFTINGVEFTDLTTTAGDLIEAGNLSYHFVEYELPDTVKDNAFMPAGVPIYPLSDIPDPLSNEASITVAAQSTQPIFITNYVPSAAAPGHYEGLISLNTTLGTFQIPIQVEVSNVEIPALSDSEFINYQWAMTNGFTWDGLTWDSNNPQAMYDVGEKYYDVPLYSDEWFDLLDEFATVMTDYRQNMIWLRTDLLLQAKGTYLSEFKDGIPESIDWSVFDRYVQTFIDKGMTHFANTHLIHSLNYMPPEEKPSAEVWSGALPAADSMPVTDAYVRNYMTALHDHLEEKGWLNEDGFTWYQHIRDEPIADKDRNYWTYIARQIKQDVPDFKTMDADPNGVLMNDATKSYVDVWVPLTPAFQAKKGLYKAEQEAGKDMWVYTCDVNQPPWLNRFWTQPTLTGRLLFWNLNQEGVTGHLHWAWNAWYVGSYYGDSTIVYPDKKNMTVKSSLRYEAQRDGLEDYELMDIVKASNPDLAKQIADSVVNPADPRKYSLDPSYIKTLHDYLVRAAAGEPVGEVPQAVSPYMGQEISNTYMTDSASGDITFSGSWFPKIRQFAYNGSVQASSGADADLEYEFYGSGIDVIVEKNEDSGKIAISVDDGEPVIVDAYEKVQHDYFTIYSQQGLTPGKHKIKVMKAGGDSSNLYFDAFRVHKYDGQILYDASLKSLDISGAPSFSFSSSKTKYQIMIPEDTSEITITPTQLDAGGTLSIGGKTMESGMAAKAIIPNGKSKITLLITASDGVTQKQYTLNFLKGNKNEESSNIARDYAEITASAARSGEGAINYGPYKMVDGSYDSMYASMQGYVDTHPFPHEIVLTWDEPKDFNTLVMNTKSGLLQGIIDIDVQVSTDGVSWETVVQRIPFNWESDQDGVSEFAYGNIPAVSGAKKLRIQINDAYYKQWNMYAVYELELYNLPDNGEVQDITLIRDVVLSGLAIKDVKTGKPIDISFDPSKKAYQIELGMESNKVEITPTLKNNYGTLTFNGVSVASGNTAIATLPDGLSTLTVKLAGDQGISKEYTLQWQRAIENIALKAQSITLDKPMEGSTSVDTLIDGNYSTIFTNGKFNAIADFNFPHTIDLKWNEPQSFNTIHIIAPDGVTDHKVSTFAIKVKKSGDADWTQILHDGQTWVVDGNVLFWPLYKGLNPDNAGGTLTEKLPILAQEGITDMQIMLYGGHFYQSPYYYEINELEITNIVEDGQIVIEVVKDNEGGNPGNVGGGFVGSVDPQPAKDVHVIKPADIRNPSQEGIITIPVSEDANRIELPTNAAELLGKNRLAIQAGGLTLILPAEVLQQLVSQLSAGDLKDGRIELLIQPLNDTDAAAIVAKGETSSKAKLTLSGKVYDFGLAFVSKSGKATNLTEFDQPVTIRMAADSSVNPVLSGLYYLADDGTLEYVGGHYEDDELAAEIRHFSKYAILEYKKSFVDVPKTHWAADVIEQLTAKHIIKGVSATAFVPAREVTRAEFTVLLAGALKLTATGDSGFTDVAKEAWYAQGIAAAAKAGIVNGKDERAFDPNGIITREQMAVMMMKAYEVWSGKKLGTYDTARFSDSSEVSSWAAKYVGAAGELGVMKGRAADKFAPKGTATRAEAAQAIYNLLSTNGIVQ
ncbi:glycoside hydrolase domain-containing protein [Paenibacillus mendelii]|uniref:Glycoside hydrolase domain-containing protein n=1 Tax=Paenibacillus mendelii TaxID=206163 RepID=A0ABV6J9G5_9BACL|nr:glycoside hydrolase domain-containing protein [Paenibacillus mendelii]MCQ6559863.1 S-layer homology domain-containing protein [Paenibacillus mendelii]